MAHAEPSQQQMSEVVEDLCRQQVARMHPFLQFQRSLIPAFGFGGTTSALNNNPQQVTSQGRTPFIAWQFSEYQTLAAAPLGLCPLLLFQRNPGQVVPRANHP